jgi:hypothetical protein
MDTPAPESVLAQVHADADALRRNGHAAQAASLDAAADALERAVLPFIEWLSEDRALTRSGESVRWFRRQRAGWAARGLARKNARGQWEYRACIVPDAGRAPDGVADVDALADQLLRAG